MSTTPSSANSISPAPALGGHAGPIFTQGRECGDCRHFVYLHKRLTTLEVFYVGKGTMAPKYPSPYRALTTGRRNPLWQRTVSKDGGYIAEIVGYFSSEAESLQKEVELIACYGRRDLGRGLLSNLTDGGEGTSGHIASESLRKKRSLRCGPLAPRWGLKWSDEQKQAWSVLRRGRTHQQAAKDKVSHSLRLQYAAGRQSPRSRPLLIPETGEYYVSESAAAKALGMLRQTLRAWLAIPERNKIGIVRASSLFRTEARPWAC